MKLDVKDRLILVNQFKILEALYPDEASSYREHRIAIEDGFTLHYDEIVESFSDEMSEDECKNVLDILSMYRAITFSNEQLPDSDKVEHHLLKFRGFDGNNEPKQYSYSRYFILELGRFDELRYGQKRPELNSHTPMLERYFKMLSRWKSLDSNYELNKDEIISILEAN